MFIGKLAEAAGVNVQTVRYYERLGLLSELVRTESGYRIYGESALKRLRFIKQAQAFGFTLEQILELLPGSEAGQESKPTPIFCPAKSSGQLCDHGTADRLKLEGPNRERWDAAVRRYNGQVESAQKQLIEDARGFLTPEQAKQVESYFAPARSRADLAPTASASKPGSATIKVTGMTCSGCAKSIEQALGKVDGVREAKVSYERGIAEVMYDNSKINLDQIYAAIRKTGFGVGDGKPKASCHE